MKMIQINVTVDDKILEEFRSVIYKTSGLQRGDLKKYLEIAMAEYIVRHSKFTESKKFAKDYAQKLQKG